MLNDIRKHPYFSSLLLIVLVLTVFGLTSCAEVSALRSGVAEHGADAADQALDSAIWAMCSGSPVGAVKRRFDTPHEQAAYNVICPEESLPPS